MAEEGTAAAECSDRMASNSQQMLTLHECSPARATRIAVLGGSFDPITCGHLKCACEIVHARKAQEVWIVPCGTRPDKPSLKTPYMHRLIMCHLAVNTTFGSSFPIRVCDIEMPEKQALSTYHLMKRLQQDYPGKEFSFVLGADLLESLKAWDAPGVPDAGVRLWNECSFIVLDRPPLTTYYVLLTSHHSPLTAHYSLLTTHYSLHTTHFALHTTH